MADDLAVGWRSALNIKYDEKYIIRLAAKEDIAQIMTFIDTYWKKGHILAVNRSFFEYEFLEPNGSVNFILAIDRQQDTLEGILGYLKASHDEECMDIWGSIWKVKEGNIPLLGLELSIRLEEMVRYKLGIGANPKTTISIMKILPNRKAGKMKHFYRLCKKQDFHIACIEYLPKSAAVNGSAAELSVEIQEINDFKAFDENYTELLNKDSIPYKDKNYIRRRFFEHPIYEYKVYGISTEGRSKAIIVFREETVDDRKALRIVDYVGEQSCFGCLGSFFDSMKEQYEYIDFYCMGFEERYIYEAGFTLRKDDDANIIPNYFHPFEQRNVDIWVHYPVDGVLFCKADGDQDRPNL